MSPDDWPIVFGVVCVVCPGCAFTFAAEHTDETEGYSCPNCGFDGYEDFE